MSASATTPKSGLRSSGELFACIGGRRSGRRCQRRSQCHSQRLHRERRRLCRRVRRPCRRLRRHPCGHRGRRQRSRRPMPFPDSMGRRSQPSSRSLSRQTTAERSAIIATARRRITGRFGASSSPCAWMASSSWCNSSRRSMQRARSCCRSWQSTCVRVCHSSSSSTRIRANAASRRACSEGAAVTWAAGRSRAALYPLSDLCAQAVGAVRAFVENEISSP